MKLNRLLEEAGRSPLQKDCEIDSIVADSGKCNAKSIFAAIRGHRADGADYAKDAYEKGCRIFICDRKLPLPADASFILTDRPRKTAYRLSSALYGEPQSKLHLVGITGTKGKTTVAFLLTALLNAVGFPSFSVGTEGIVGLHEENLPTVNTTPDLLFLLPHFAEAVKRGKEFAILEVSSQALADRRIDGLHFDTVLFTAFGQDHVGENEHPTEAAYFAAKRRLFTDFGAVSSIYNADDLCADRMTEGIKKKTGIGFGAIGKNRISSLKNRSNGSSFLLGEERVVTKLSGDYNARNVALALTAASELTKMPISVFIPKVKYLTVPGRFRVLSRYGRRFVIDYAHNAMSVSALINLSKTIFCGDFYAVIGSVGGRGTERRRQLSEALEPLVGFTVLTSDDPGEEPAVSIAAEMHEAFRDKSRATVICDRREAIRYACRLSKPGDTVFLLGKGNESFQTVGKEKIPYSDENALLSLDKSDFLW